MECGSSAAAFSASRSPPNPVRNFSTHFHSRNDPITPRQPLHPSQLPRIRSNPRPSFEQSLNISIILLTIRRKSATIPYVSPAKQLHPFTISSILIPGSVLRYLCDLCVKIPLQHFLAIPRCTLTLFTLLQKERKPNFFIFRSLRTLQKRVFRQLPYNQ